MDYDYDVDANADGADACYTYGSFVVAVWHLCVSCHRCRCGCRWIRTFGAIGTLTLTRSRTRTPIVPVPSTPTTIAMLPIQAVTIVRLEQLVP